MLIWATHCNLEFQNRRFLGAIVVFRLCCMFICHIYLLRAHSPFYSPKPSNFCCIWQPSTHPRVRDAGCLSRMYSPPHSPMPCASLVYLPRCSALVRVQGSGEPQRHLARETFTRPGIWSKVYPWAVNLAGSAFFCWYFLRAPYGPEIVLIVSWTFYMIETLCLITVLK